MKAKVVHVEWGDAWAGASWTDGQSVTANHDPLTVHTVGILVKLDKRGASLVRGVSENGDFLGQSFIPKGMIKKITLIKNITIK